MPQHQDRLAYDTGVSASVQTDIGSIIGQLEALIADRQGQVNRAMADFTATDVADQYRSVESRWNNASTEVRGIIALIKKTLGLNDETARDTLKKARTIVQSI